ncbi:MAG: orotate phosphoribosyltransferase [Gammaproteobacteria bacterium]|nr:orotate phosphoribosyltransferase [Gammaproteobacteria bacterium]
MQDYKKEFIDFAISTKVLCFGQFELKSGRISPYFFNSGLFDSGAAIARLGRYYAAAIEDSNIDYDQLFGPAYKGIPLAVTTACALADYHHKDIAYSFNRKEAKNHGEGGTIVGAPLAKKVLIIDDVISAGTSVRESVDIISAANAQTAGVIIALDRQERGQGDTSAIQEVEKSFNIKVANIINLSDLIEYLSAQSEMKQALKNICNYQKQYGI